MAEIDLDKIKNNSNAARRNDPPKEEHVMEKPPTFLSKILGRFAFGSIEEAKEAVIDEVIIPTLLDGARDCIYTMTDHILYGGVRTSSSRRKGSYTTYGKKSQQKSGGSSVRKTAPATGGYNFIFDTRKEADDVLEQMRDVIDAQDCVSIMEMFAIAKRKTSNFTYTDWGWYDLSRAMVKRTSDGRFYIDLPKAVPIED